MITLLSACLEFVVFKPEMFSISYFLLPLLALTALALPSWDAGYTSQPTLNIGNLVPGASFIEALGSGVSYEQYKPKYLSIAAARGEPGNTIIYNDLSPPLYYINDNQLYQFTNLSSILQINVLNVTEKSPVPLKLTADKKPKGVIGGTWRWQGTRLFYDYGTKGNSGLFYHCIFPQGDGHGVYMTLDPMPLPEGCQFSTLHSFTPKSKS